MKSFDVQVSGAGIVGQCLALCLARIGLSVALRSTSDPVAAGPDVRAYALNAASVTLLQSLKVWDALPAHAATPVYDIQVHGDQSGASLEFSAWQQHVGALAWITDAAVLERELALAVRFSPHIVSVTGDVQAPLVAICEGQTSAARAALGVTFKRHRHGQQAIAARLTCTQNHCGVARQWFRSPDVLALLPFDAPQTGQSYALVWSLPDQVALELMALDDAAFEQRLMQAVLSEVGELSLASKRVAWPLSQACAQTWCGPGWVLLGDAAHVVHPLAGQGLNLGLADVRVLADVLTQREPWRSLGDQKLLRRYARERLMPNWAMGQVTDGMLRLFAHPQPLLHELRNGGLRLVNKLTPIKRWLAQRALDS